jgi:hypothetical protein
MGRERRKGKVFVNLGARQDGFGSGDENVVRDKTALLQAE